MRRRQLFAKREEQLQEQKAETLAHLEDVDRRLKEKQRRTEERIERQKKEAVEREMGRAAASAEADAARLAAAGPSTSTAAESFRDRKRLSKVK